MAEARGLLGRRGEREMPQGLLGSLTPDEQAGLLGALVSPEEARGMLPQFSTPDPRSVYAPIKLPANGTAAALPPGFSFLDDGSVVDPQGKVASAQYPTASEMLAHIGGNILGVPGGLLTRVPMNPGEVALGAGPMRGTPPLAKALQESAPAVASEGMREIPKTKLGTVEDILTDLGVEFRKENSTSMSDRHGPSMSAYYYAETPNGRVKIRVSDHNYPSTADVDVRLGDSADKARSQIMNALGREVPPELSERLQAAEAATPKRPSGLAALNAAIKQLNNPQKRNR